MFVHENFEFERAAESLKNMLVQTNLFVPDVLYDEQKMLKICEVAADLHIGMMTVHHAFVENIWKWIEKKNVKICAFADCELFYQNQAFDFSKMFSAVKNAFQNGANFIDIRLPEHVDSSQVLEIATNAVGGKNNVIKIAVNRKKFPTTLQIKDFMKSMLAMKIMNFKTDDFARRYEKKSDMENEKTFATTVCDVNAILDFIHQSKFAKDMRMDIVANIRDENGFSFYDSANMLCSSIFGDENFFKNNVIFTRDILSVNKILQQNS